MRLLQSLPIQWLTLTLAYLASGKLGLLLAIPPGYATAIFPPAGVALAGLLLGGSRLWPGVFLGSLGLNLWIHWGSHGGLSLAAWGVAAGIGAGAALQSLLSAHLVRRWVGYPTPLIHEREVVLFLLLGGPLACLVGATVGTLVLVVSQSIPQADMPFTWWTWWVGDSLGVVITIPLIFSFVAQPHAIWRQRRLSLALPLGALLLLIILVFVRASSYEDSRIRFKFQTQADNLAHSLEVNLNGHLQFIRAMERFYSASAHVDRAEFHQFTAHAFESLPGIRALEWVPRVVAARKGDFEQAAHMDGLSDFRVWERDEEDLPRPAGLRDVYYPVLYVEPLADNQTALGFDLASDPARKAALEQARDTGQWQATARITLVQEQHRQYGVLVLHPVYQGGETPDTVEGRRTALSGFVLGVFRVDDMVSAGISQPAQDDIELRLLDMDAPADSRELLHWAVQDVSQAYAGLSLSVPFNMAGRRWQFHFTGTTGYVAKSRTQYPWMVLAGGLLFASLSGAFLLLITGRVSRVEVLLEQRTRELKDRESRMSAVVDSAVSAIFTISEQGTIESINEAAVRMFGYERGEMVGNNINMLMPSPHHENHDDYLKRYLASGERRIVGTTREVEGLRKDGVIIPLELSVSDVPLDQGRIFTGILHDISERKKAERMKREFVSTVSHELRTPLTSIKGSLGLLAGGVLGKLPDKAMALVTRAMENTDRLTLLINDLLDMEKIQQGGMAFQMAPLALGTLLQEAMSANQGYAERFAVRLRLLDMADPGWQVHGDKNRLLQVLANLLSNAIKFSPAQEEVTIAAIAHQEGVRISVTDHGEGIPEDFHPRIFQKFAQADASTTRPVGGTGLGLAISKAIVEKHGGMIGFTTQSGKGTTFYFTLPIHPTGEPS